jgi:hypothetical protein
MHLGVSYLGAYLPEHLRADLADIRAVGCDEVLVTLAENDFHILPGKVRFTPAIAHDLGLRVLANFWGFACAFGGGRVSRLLTEDPEVWVLGPGGARLGMGCMNHPALLARAREMVDRCVETGYDGFFWDEPTQQDCYCPHCTDLFAGLYGSDLCTADGEQVEAFRLQSIVRYVRTMSDYVKALRPELETATCVMPCDEAAWEPTARIPSLDTFGTDPYWLCLERPLAWVSESTRQSLKVCRSHGKRSLMWLQGWMIPAGREREIEEAAWRLAAEGPDALYTWSYRGGLGSNEACDDPEAAWQVVVEVYRALRERGM